MGLSSELLSQFAKVTNDKSKDKKETSTVYGTVVNSGTTTYVQFDGSSAATPVSTTVNVKKGDRVIVMIKNHTATITGNLNDPSINTESLNDYNGDLNDRVTQLGIAVADRVSTTQLNTVKAQVTEELTAKDAVIRDTLTASIVEATGRLEAADAEIAGKLTAAEAQLVALQANKLSVEDARATYATIVNLEATNTQINNLQATHAAFENATARNFEVANASIADLDAAKLDAESAKVIYANIDFSNIGEAAIRKFFSESGMIENLVVGDGTVTGKLVGVTISGDLIEGNTVKAEKLVVKGSDGLYYKLNIEAGATTSSEVKESDLQNGLHGTAIIAKTITAEKISVSDLVAFGATIGGFHISNSSLYSGAKSAVDNATQGIYMDSTGQFSLGDGTNYIKYFKDTDGQYKLDISMMQNVATKTDIDSIHTKIKYDQLVINGSGELGNNTNFSSLDFDGTTTNNSVGSFTRTDTKYVTVYTDELLPLNAQREYTLQFDAKTKNKVALLYAFLYARDIDGNVIWPDHHMHIKGSLTTLARDLNDGDTKIYLTDLSGWITTMAHMYNIILWGYTNSYGYTYPEETYSRFSVQLPTTPDNYLDTNYVDFENNVITLKTPWNKGSFSAGTKVSQGGSGGTFKYLVYTTPDTNWTTYSGKMIGTDYSGTNADNAFPPGTAYASVGFLWNYNSANDQIWVTNVGVRDTTDITDTQNALESIRASVKVNSDSITSSITKINRLDSIASGSNGRNLLTNSEGDFIGNANFYRTEYDLTPIFEKHGLVEYTISMDMKSADTTNGDQMTAYFQNGSGSYYQPSCITPNMFTVTTEWRRYSFSFVPRRNPSYTSDIKAMLAFYGYGTGNFPRVRKIKLELGLKDTDWFPAPEDMATSTTVEKAQYTADEAETKAANAQTLIAQLSESISMLVTDGNGTSLMTQTEDGWTFSTANIQNSVNRVSDSLGLLTEEIGDVGSTVDVLQQAVADLGEIAEYVKIGTYESEPCIELGEGDSDFKLRITNTRMLFTEGSDVLAYFNNQSLHIKKAVVEEELHQGGFVWKIRSNGNLGLVWKGGNN